STSCSCKVCPLILITFRMAFVFLELFILTTVSPLVGFGETRVSSITRVFSFSQLPRKAPFFSRADTALGATHKGLPLKHSETLLAPKLFPQEISSTSTVISAEILHPFASVTSRV